MANKKGSDSRGYEEIIDGTKNPSDEKENLEILEEDNADNKKAKKESCQSEWPTKKVIETW